MSRRFPLAILLLTIVPTYSRAQQTPPPPAAPRAVSVPHPSEKTLENGLRVIVVEKTGLPLVATRLLVKTGGEADPSDRAGLADMTASLLTKGTKTKNAEEIALGVEALGATIDSGAGWDNSFVALGALANNYPDAMKYVSDVVMHPTFAQDEIDRLRDQNIDALRVAMQNPAQLAGFVAARVLYGGAPYGHNLGGTPESLQKITRDDVVKFHQTYYRPDNAVLVVAGDVKPADVFSVAQKLFGGWSSSGGQAPPPVQASVENHAQRVVVIDMPEAGQAAVVVTRRGLQRVDPNFFVAQVANSVLGGGYSSRLNQEIRIKRGLSYGAGSMFEFRRDAGPFSASVQTKNESAVEVAGLIGGEISKMASTSVPESELTPRKATLSGDFGRSIETTSGLVRRVGALAVYGLSLGQINDYVKNVQSVTAADVQKFATEHLAGDADIVIVGDMKKIGDALKKAYPNAEIIPIDQLDLDSPTLRKK
jgi:zinc protease